MLQNLRYIKGISFCDCFQRRKIRHCLMSEVDTNRRCLQISKAFIVRNKRLGLKDVYINVLTFWKLWAELKVWNDLKAKLIYGELSQRFFASLNFHHLNRTNDFCHQKSVNLVFAHSIKFSVLFSRETKSFHKTWLTDFFVWLKKLASISISVQLLRN